jgi:hypothetical protein
MKKVREGSRSKSSPSRPRAPFGAVFAVAAKRAIDTLQAVDGRASGLKFNKLVLELFWHLSKSENKAMHFDVPYRWYLYGAVVDDYAVQNLVRFDHPDDEYRTDTIWIGPPKPKVPAKAEGLAEEVVVFAQNFATKYAGRDGIPPMLRDHYAKAPLDFQRDFLEWSLLGRAILDGYQDDSPAQTQRAFVKLQTSFPRDLEARLSPAFERLTLYLEPYIAERVPGDLRTLELALDVLWEFWKVFGLFLSIRHLNAIPPDRIDRYRVRAEIELEAYKRRLTAFLQDRYIRENPGVQQTGFDLSQIGRFLSEEVRSRLDGGD